MKGQQKMRQILIALALVCLMTSTVFAEGGDGKKAQKSGGVVVQPVSTGNQQAVVSLNPFRETVVIRVMNEEGITLYKEIHSPKGLYRKLYDFSALEAGEYILNVKTRTEEYTKSVYLQDGYLIADQISIDISEQPIMHYLNNQLLVAYYNSENEKVIVSFLDNTGDIIYESKGSTEVVFQEKYDLNTLKKGTYQVTISAGDSNFQDYLEVQ